MSSPKDELVAIIIAALHAKRLQDYVEDYRQRHGKNPGKSKIDDFIAMVIASGSVPEEANEIADEMYTKFIRSTKRKRVIFDFAIGIPIAAALLLLIGLLLSKKLPKEIADNSLAYAIPCIVILVLVITGMVAQFRDESKR